MKAMAHKSKLPYDHQYNVWSEKVDFTSLIIMTISLCVGTIVFIVISPLISILFSIFWIIVVLTIAKGHIERLHRTHRFFRLPNTLPDSKLVMAIEEALNERGIKYIKKSGGKYYKKFPVDYAIKVWGGRYTEIFELPEHGVFIEVGISVSEYVPVHIGKITEETRPFINKLTELLDEHVGRKEDEYFEEKFIKQLSDQDPEVRMGSAHGLGLLESKKAVPPLIESLGKEKRPVVKGAIIQALAKVGDESVIPVLERYFSDMSEALTVEDEKKVTVGYLAKSAVRKIKDKNKREA